MATTYPLGIFRKTVTATKPSAGPESKGVMLIPSGFLRDMTVVAYGSAASTAKVEQTYADGEAISTGTAAWVSLHASMDSVGTTPVAYDLGAHTPSAIRVSSLTSDQTATMILLAKST